MEQAAYLRNGGEEAAWGGVGTTDAREVVATTDFGWGGGGVLGVAG